MKDLRKLAASHIPAPTFVIFEDELTGQRVTDIVKDVIASAPRADTPPEVVQRWPILDINAQHPGSLERGELRQKRALDLVDVEC